MSIINDKFLENLKNIKPETIRKGFGEGLLVSGGINRNIVALCADLTESTQMHFFKEKIPERFVEIGVAEQNLATVASGMSAMGKIPVISSYAVFSPGRNWEQIRTTICYNNRHVIIAGSHAGISVGPDGGSHQALEDIALMRVLPNMIVVSPCDYNEAKKAIIALTLENKFPAYIRLLREKTPIITNENDDFEIGKITKIYTNTTRNDFDICIMATGSMVFNGIEVANHFNQGNIKDKKIAVLNVSTIKPIDEKTILDFAKRSKQIVTLEEHQIAGGLGSAICEVLADKFPIKITRIGVNDSFGQSGTPQELAKHYGLDTDSIIKRIENL